MANQRNDARVLSDARKRDAINDQLTKALRRAGVRSMRSKRARELIERACLEAVERAVRS